MGFFRQSDDSSGTSRRYLERAPRGQRKDLLAMVCVNQVAAMDIARAERYGDPVADVVGLEPAAEVVRDVLRQDRSMYAWVARTSLVALDDVVGALAGTWDAGIDVAMEAIGLEPGPALRPDLAESLTPDQQERVVGLAAYAFQIFFSFDSPHRAGQRSDAYARMFESTAPSTALVAHDITAWAAVVIGRLCATDRIPPLGFMNADYSKPTAMDEPGWYPNPYNRGTIENGDATFQRYWDGDDWTDRIRLRDGRKWINQTHSLHTAPDN